jgi:hypothetical protein
MESESDGTGLNPERADISVCVLSRAPPCFGRHVKPLVPAAFAVHPPALDPRGGLRPVLLMCNPYERRVPHQWGH